MNPQKSLRKANKVSHVAKTTKKATKSHKKTITTPARRKATKSIIAQSTIQPQQLHQPQQPTRHTMTKAPKKTQSQGFIAQQFAAMMTYFTPQQQPQQQTLNTIFQSTNQQQAHLPTMNFITKATPTHSLGLFDTALHTTTMESAFLQRFNTHTTAVQHVSKRNFSAAETLADDTVVVPPHMEKKYKRLMFQATQRGWLELDLIFTAYVATFKAKLLSDEKNLDYLTDVCACDNSDLVRWFVEGKPLPDEWKKNPIMVDMLEYALLPSKPWYPNAGNQ